MSAPAGIEVVVVPETVPAAADQIQTELEEQGYPITLKIQRALDFLREHSYGGRRHTRKNKKANKKSKKTRGRK